VSKHVEWKQESLLEAAHYGSWADGVADEFDDSTAGATIRRPQVERRRTRRKVVRWRLSGTRPIMNTPAAAMEKRCLEKNFCATDYDAAALSLNRSQRSGGFSDSRIKE